MGVNLSNYALIIFTFVELLFFVLFENSIEVFFAECCNMCRFNAFDCSQSRFVIQQSELTK